MNSQDRITKLFLVDDHTLVRHGFASLVGHQGDMEVVGQCGTGGESLELISNIRPDLVLLDISLPDMNGIDVCGRLKRKMPRIKVVMLSMHDELEYISASAKRGADGYLLKEAAPDQLIPANRIVIGGGTYFGPAGLDDFAEVSDATDGSSSDNPFEVLTARERQVLKLIADGKSNRNIAEILDLSVKTVDTHRSRLMKKLDIHDQTNLVKYAIRKGLAGLG